MNSVNDSSALTVIHADCLEWMAGAPASSFQLVLGSPPYPEKGERYIGGAKKWRTDDWVAWMLKVTEAACRVSSGLVLWVVNGAVRGGRYLPACEGLIWEWYKAGGWSDRSVIWHKNAPPNRLGREAVGLDVRESQVQLTIPTPPQASRRREKTIPTPPQARILISRSMVAGHGGGGKSIEAT